MFRLSWLGLNFHHSWFPDGFAKCGTIVEELHRLFLYGCSVFGCGCGDFMPIRSKFILIECNPISKYENILKVTQNNLSLTIIKDIRKLLGDIRIYVYILWCISIGLFTALIWNFLFWLIEDLASNQGCDSQQWVKSLEGILIAVQCLIGETPFFFFSGWILNKLGHIHSMTLIMLVFSIRLILYSVIPNPWWFLPVELLNGFTFGLFYSCMVSYASILAPTGTEATMQVRELFRMNLFDCDDFYFCFRDLLGLCLKA